MIHIRILKGLLRFNALTNTFITLSLLFCLNTTKAQDDTYFPQEQIVLEQCSNASNFPDCTYTFFESKISTFLRQNKKVLRKSENDSIRFRVTMVVNSKGKIDNNMSRVTISPRNIDRKLKKKINSVFKGLVITKVMNSKQPSISKHFLDFDYSIKMAKLDLTFNLIKNEDKYTGGVIEEIPIFPGCEGLDDENSRICFQQKIAAHIESNFQYPKLALEKKLEGRVSVIFVITKEGEITNIRTRGPHSILEKDAIKIIKLLPRMTPAKQNGVPVKIPFAIPITYKL